MNAAPSSRIALSCLRASSASVSSCSPMFAAWIFATTASVFFFTSWPLTRGRCRSSTPWRTLPVVVAARTNVRASRRRRGRRVAEQRPRVADGGRDGGTDLLDGLQHLLEDRHGGVQLREVLIGGVPPLDVPRRPDDVRRG